MKPKVEQAELKLQEKLISACESEDIKEVQRLLDAGANPNQPNATGKQPLGAAISKGIPVS